MLNRLAAEFAAEIASHDWSDAPYRLDRAGHQIDFDSPGKRVAAPLDTVETARLLTNVMWVTAQVLKHADPNLNLHEYAAACGVPRAITHRTNGSRSDVIVYGLRWDDVETTTASRPGAPLWRVQVQCEVENVVVFKRMLAKIAVPDPTVPPAEVEATVGTTRVVTMVVRAWNKSTAGDQVVDIVSAASLAIVNGTDEAVLLDVSPLYD